MSRRKKDNSTQVLTTDAFSNPLFRLGYGSQAPLEATEYILTRLTDNYARLNAMYRSGGILQSVVDIIPEDMTREWYTLGGDIKPEDMDALERAERNISLRSKVIDGLRWGRLYGGAAGIMLIKGQDNWEKPLNLKAVMPDSFRGLYILDRWSGIFPGADLVTDLMDPDFGLPEYYDISTGEGTNIVARVHHSRVVRFTGRPLPYLERLAEMHWGESEIEPVYEDIVLYDNIMHNMGNLTFRANVSTMEVQNLDQLFGMASTEQQRRFWQVMQAQSVCESNFGTRLINKGDAYHTQSYSFTGFDHVTEAAQLNLAAKTHIPMTKLFGRSPAGMNATGESDMKNYYDIVDGQREAKLRPVLEKILPVLCMSTWGKVPEDIQIQFPPLWTPTATELAQIASTKTQTIMAAFQSNAITLGMALTELKKLEDETGMFGSIDEQWIKKNENKTFAELQQMGDPMAGLMGGFGGGKEDPKKDLIAQENEGNIDQPKKEEDDGNK
jgi:phage-related protein (TIGR01555 family)